MDDRVRVKKTLFSRRRFMAAAGAMYGYPPDLSEDATQLVLKQAELSTEAGS